MPHFDAFTVSLGFYSESGNANLLIKYFIT